MFFRKKFVPFMCFLLITTSCAKSPVFHDTKGHTITSAELKDKWLILTYWASWCSVCKREIPTLNHLYENNHNEKIVFYGVNYDRLPAGELTEIIHTLNIKFPVLIEDPNLVWKMDEVTAVPTTFILNPNRKTVKKIVGPASEQEMLDAIQTT